MTQLDRRLTALEQRQRRTVSVCSIVDVRDAATPEEARQRITTHQNLMKHSGSTSPLIIIDR